MGDFTTSSDLAPGTEEERGQYEALFLHDISGMDMLLSDETLS